MTGELATLASALAAVAASLAGLLTYMTKRETSAINDAVNQKHPNGARLYDLVLRNDAAIAELLAWKRGHEGGPLETGASAKMFADRMDHLDRTLAIHGHRLQEVEARTCR